MARKVAAAAVIAGVVAIVSVTAPPLAIAQNFTVDSGASEALTTYLRQHRLPLVGAQIGTATAGARRVVLYGYVATQFGKTDAESKALAYLGAPPPEVVNRIVIQPEIGRMKASGKAAAGSGSAAEYAGAEAGGAFAGESFDQVIQDIQRYGIKSPPDEQGNGSP
jgi:hypothetical protein